MVLNSLLLAGMSGFILSLCRLVLNLTHDSALFIRQTSVGLVLPLLYIDDMIIVDSDSAAIIEVKSNLFP